MQLSVRGLRLAQALVEVVPIGIARPAARGIGMLVSQVSSDQRTVVERNLRRVYGGAVNEAALARQVRDVFANYALYWLDSLRVPGMTTRDLDGGLSIEGIEHLMEPLHAGQGVVAAIPHLGSWEAGARWLSEVQGINVVAAVEKLEPPELYEWFVEYRTKALGIEVVPVDGNASKRLAGALASGALLTLLCDRDLTGDGVEVEFFGEVTTLPAGPAMLALRTGSPLVPLAVYQRGKGHHGRVLQPIEAERRGRLRDDVQRVTQDLAHALEELIRAEPTQWHVLQPNWPSDVEALAGRSGRSGGQSGPELA